MGILDDRFCLAYAGAILASRDLESLLRHARRHPEDVVLIAGTGDREPWLRKEAAGLENVRFLGWLVDPSVLLAAADALYYALRPDHPYAALAAPNNLYVAIANAVPLVYRSQGELSEVGRDHEIGAPFTDDPSMDAAVDIVRDPAANARIRASLAALSADYTWERAVEPLLAVYPQAVRAIISASPKGP
jgi:glycosyltransferase involved in cell wall biosynthesis